jgi:hypothetical protein
MDHSGLGEGICCPLSEGTGKRASGLRGCLFTETTRSVTPRPTRYLHAEQKVLTFTTT